MKINKILLLTLFTVSATVSSYAQDQEVGGFIGASIYRGDLDQTPWAGRNTRPAIGGIYRYYLSPKFNVRAGLNFTYLAAYDNHNGGSSEEAKSRNKRGLRFFSHLLELNGMVEYNILNFVPGSAKYRWTPYVFGGVALFNFNPKTNLGGTVYTLKDYETEPGKSYSTVGFAIPFGGGVKYNFGKESLWNIGLEAGWRLTFTDYLDDVSAKFGPNPPPSDPIAAKLAKRGPTNRRGNPDNNDAYILVGFTLTKTIRKYRCF